MSLTIEIPDDNAAKCQKVPTEPVAAKPLQTVADIVRSHMGKIPAEIMAATPKDGASQHDHYIYGWPKRDV